MSWYKTSQTQEEDLGQSIQGPDLESLVPSRNEIIIENLKKRFPEPYKALAKLLGLIKEEFTLETKPYEPPKDVSQRPLD